MKLECPKDFDIVTFFDNNQVKLYIMIFIHKYIYICRCANLFQVSFKFKLPKMISICNSIAGFPIIAYF